jgi:hypothetical protein
MSTNTLSNADHATPDMASLCASMQREITSLRASQIAANREITYLRRNQDRAVREISSEINHLRSGVKVMQSQLQEMGESQKTLLYVVFLTFHIVITDVVLIIVVGEESSGVKLMLLPPDQRRHLCHPVGPQPQARVDIDVSGSDDRVLSEWKTSTTFPGRS